MVPDPLKVLSYQFLVGLCVFLGDISFLIHTSGEQCLYVAFDIDGDINGDTLTSSPSRPLRRLLRHTASVPKGFLRYYVLRLLKERPMSGSEIMDEIGKQTGEQWRPSPGSVYPLLGWLQERGYTEEVPAEESGIRRYMLIEKGERLFEEQSRLREKLQERLEFFAPSFISVFWLSSHPEKMREIREPVRKFAKSLFDLRRALDVNPTDRALEEVGDFLNRTAEKIEEICSKIRGV